MSSPREERRRVKRVKRWDISSGSATADTCPDPEDGRTAGTLACSPWGPRHSGNAFGLPGPSKRNAQAAYTNLGREDLWSINWETQVITDNNDAVVGAASPDTAGWLELATARAKEICRAQHGGQSVSNVAFGQGHSRDQTPVTARDRGPHLGWFFDNHDGAANKFRARQSRTWTATCKKTTRHTRK